MSVLTLEAKLEREHASTSWGFRMGGGKDFSAPLTIQKVDPGSLAAKCGLQVGDIILRIGSGGTEHLKHKEAKDAIIASGNRLDLLLQRKIPNNLLNSACRGGSGGYDRFNGPQINTNWNAPAAAAPVAAPSPKLNFNNAPRPFGGQAPAPAPVPVQSMQNMSINGAKDPSPFQRQDPPAFQSVTPQLVTKEPPALHSLGDKYAEQEEADPSLHQSKSFKYLQNLMDKGKELNTALKPVNTPTTFNKPPEPQGVPSPAPLAAPIGPGSKPGTVKAVVSQRYNNPLGLYSKDNASNQLEGQSKFLMEKDDLSGVGPPTTPKSPSAEYDDQGRKRYVPSETFKLVQEEVGLLETEKDTVPAHSRTFRMLQNQMGSVKSPRPPAPAPAPVQAYKPAPAPAPAPAPVPVAAKPWIQTPAPAPAAPAPPAPVVNASPRPFGAPLGGKPSCPGGPLRGKKGDASMNPAAMTNAGRIPVCAACNNPIRGPFVTALGKCWCPDCFVCANPQCRCKLLDIGFVEEAGQLYCEKDYAEFFAPHCDSCGKAIIGECVNALNKSFCPACFLCAHCNNPIGGSKFHIEEGKFYCETHWAILFQTMCSGCDFPIEPGDRWVEAMSKNFHSECFNCSITNTNPTRKYKMSGLVK